MKKVIFYYVLALLACFAFGVICALISFFSWWCILLLSFPISLGWIPFTMMIKSIPLNKDETVGGMVSIAFIILIVLLILGDLWTSDDSFWGQTYVVGLFAAIISHIVLLSKIRNRLLNNIE